MIPFRYDLPCWKNRVYSVEVDGGNPNPMAGEEINDFLTKTKAPIALALMLHNLNRGAYVQESLFRQVMEALRAE